MDQYTEVSTVGLGSRLMDSIKGVAVGLLLFVIAFPLLWWNEGNAVKTTRSLQEGAKAVISVTSDRVDPANDRKLLHVTGQATTNETVKDPIFGVSANAIKLQRNVEMYQWREKSSSRKEKKLGGSETTTTTYTYEPAWSGELVNSAEFKHPQGHENPAMPFRSAQFVAGNVSLGAFRLSPSLISRLTGSAPVDTAQAGAPESMQAQAKPIEGGLQIGDPAAPKVGDLRVTFTQVAPQEVSVIARQVRDTFEPFPTKSGRSIELAAMGVQSAEAMFAARQRENEMLTWILRAAGLVVMFVGLMLVFRPLATVADVVPIFGDLLRVGAGVVSGAIAICLSLLTVAIAWIAYRPLVGVGLLVLVCLIVYGMIRLRSSKKPKSAAAAAG